MSAIAMRPSKERNSYIGVKASLLVNTCENEPIFAINVIYYVT